jgi:ABC-type glycerol-3-phosphate transport system permease component
MGRRFGGEPSKGAGAVMLLGLRLPPTLWAVLVRATPKAHGPLTRKGEKIMTRTRPLSNKSDLLTRIDSRVDASSQLLLILTGLGVTAAVTRFGTELDSSTPPGTVIASTIFGVFLIYSVRFFFNNWVYLSESYHRDSLKDQPEHYLLTVLRCAHFDLFLSIITGASCAFAGTLLNAEGKHLFGILALLIFHYTSDLLLLGHNYWVRRNESDSGLSPKVIFWLLNNAVFLVVFTYLLVNLPSDADTKANYMMTLV